MKSKLRVIAFAASFAFTAVAHAEATSATNNGVPGGNISTPGSEAKGNPIPPSTKARQIAINEGRIIFVRPYRGPVQPPPY